MKIHHLVIDKNDRGLKPVEITKYKLGHVVALIGANGAGKTRVLQYIKEKMLIASVESDVRTGRIDVNPVKLNENVVTQSTQKAISKYIKEVRFNSDISKAGNISFNSLINNDLMQ